MSDPWEEIQGVEVDCRERCIEGMLSETLKQAIKAALSEVTSRAGSTKADGGLVDRSGLWVELQRLSGNPREWYIDSMTVMELRTVLRAALHESNESQYGVKMEAPEYIEEREVIDLTSEDKLTTPRNMSSKRKAPPTEIKGMRCEKTKHPMGGQREEHLSRKGSRDLLEIDEDIDTDENIDLAPRRSSRLMSFVRDNPTEFEEDDDEDEDEAQFPRYLPPQQKRQKNERDPGPRSPPAREVEMLIRIPNGSGKWTWKSIDCMDPQTQDRIRERWMSDITGETKTSTRAQQWRLHTIYTERFANRERCVGYQIVSHGIKSPSKFELFGGVPRRSACDRCAKMRKLCGYWIKHEGVFKLGFVPLAGHLRHGKSWQQVGFWVMR